MPSKRKIILALDLNNFSKIKKIISKVHGHIYGVKIGYQFYFNFGVKGYNYLKKKNLKIFIDLKLHDIPHTVSMGIKALNKLKPEMITVHISGGINMLKEAKGISKKIKIIGVSALTSLNKENIRQIYNRSNINILVREMVGVAIKSKLDGIVCSPKEISLVKKLSKNKLIIITPGIRLDEKTIKSDDHKRTLSPKEAIKLGANYIVIGRPILNSKDPTKLVNKYL